MGGNSSIFKSNNKHRGGYYDTAYEEASRARKVWWPSDEDKGRWGVADPVIDMKASAFIAKYKEKVLESEIHYQPQVQH